MTVCTTQQPQIRKFKEKDWDQLTDPNGPWAFAKITRTRLEWITQYWPENDALLVASLDDQIIGYFPNIAVPFKVKNKIINAYSGGLFVHPAYRNQKYNVFNLLVKGAHQAAREKSSIVYGFPIPALLKYYNRRIQAHVLKTIPTYIKVLNLTYFFERVLKSKRLAYFFGLLCNPFIDLLSFKFRIPKSIVIREAHSFDERFDRLWQKASPLFEITVVRNREYLNWKCRKGSNINSITFVAEKEGELLGYIKLQPVETSKQYKGVILDIFDMQDQSVTEALIDRAVTYFRGQGVSKIEFRISNDYYEAILRRSCFFKIKDKGDTDPVTLLVKSYSSEIDKKYFHDPKNWFITSETIVSA